MQSRFIVKSHYVPVFSQAPLLALDYRWPHNPPTYRKRLLTQLVLNPHCLGIQSPKHLDYRCMPLHPALKWQCKIINLLWRYLLNILKLKNARTCCLWILVYCKVVNFVQVIAKGTNIYRFLLALFFFL